MKLNVLERNGSIFVYRSEYLKKGTSGRLYDTVRHELLARFPMDADGAPRALAGKLSPTELAYVIAFRNLRKEARNAR